MNKYKFISNKNLDIMQFFCIWEKKIREQDIVKYRKNALKYLHNEAQMVLVRTAVIIILHFIQDWPSPVIDLSQLQRIIWLSIANLY